MPVDSKHSQYAAHIGQQLRCQRAFQGSDAIKGTDSDEEYLPRLSGQSDERYNAYKARSLWYNATRRTVQATAGAVWRKEPSVVLPRALEPYRQDLTLTGVNLDDFARWDLRQNLIAGRCGTLVTWSDGQKRPCATGYLGSQITNWEVRRIGGTYKLAHLRLRESERIADPADPWNYKARERYRVLLLDDDGKLVVRVYQRSDTQGTDEWMQVEELLPVRREERLDFIPFVFSNPTGTGTDVEEPVFMDLVDVNLAHYRTDADYRNALFMAGFPQLLLTGWKETIQTDSTDTDGEEGAELSRKVPIGSDYALVSTEPDADGKWLELQGHGLEPHRKELNDLENRMAALGARVLEYPKAGVEAAAAISMRHSGETSVMSEIVSGREQVLESVLGIMAWWAGASDEQTMPEEQLRWRYNRDYVSTPMDPQMLRELVNAMQTGAIDFDTFYYNLERGELTRPEDDAQTVWERIKAQGMAVLETLLPEGLKDRKAD